MNDIIWVLCIVVWYVFNQIDDINGVDFGFVVSESMYQVDNGGGIIYIVFYFVYVGIWFE